MHFLCDKRVSTFVLGVVLTAHAHACAVCMGGAGTPQADGSNAALLTMLGVMSAVFSVGTYFVVRMASLARNGGPR